MAQSILHSVKAPLGLAKEYDAFDPEIVMHINSVFSTLSQLGVGPAEGFSIEDDTSNWEDFLSDDSKLRSVRSYMYLKVRLLFDPPSTSFAIESMKKQAEEYEWRLNVAVEEKVHPFVSSQTGVL